MKSYLTNIFKMKSNDLVKYLVSEGAHQLNDCEKTTEKSVEKRSKIVGEKKLCYDGLQRISKIMQCKNILKEVEM